MTRFLSRLGQQKTFMMIRVELLEVTSTGKTKGDFQIEWKRGPEVKLSKNYSLTGGNQIVDMTDSFEKVSSFYMSSKLVVQSKTCDFKVKQKGKTIATSNFDMATQIGDLNEPTHVQFLKAGLIAKMRFTILPACRVKHAHLFSELKPEELKEDNDITSTNGNDSTRAQSLGQVSVEDMEAVENKLLWFQNQNDQLKEEVSEINDLRTQNEEIPGLKA